MKRIFYAIISMPLVYILAGGMHLLIWYGGREAIFKEWYYTKKKIPFVKIHDKFNWQIIRTDKNRR